MSLALTRDRLDIIRLLCDVTLRIVEGEIYQLTKNGVIDLSEDEHFDIVRRKTAYLFAGCAKIGGMLGTITREQQEALWDYGLNIGMAFQIADDLLDFTGDEVVLASRWAGSPRRQGNAADHPPAVTWRRARGAIIRKVVDARNVTVEEWREIRGMLGAVAIARLRAAHRLRLRGTCEEGPLRVPGQRRARRAHVSAGLRGVQRSLDQFKIKIQNANPRRFCIFHFAFCIAS
jgi:geranylgeranyl pyrophosphate synthase